MTPSCACARCRRPYVCDAAATGHPHTPATPWVGSAALLPLAESAAAAMTKAARSEWRRVRWGALFAYQDYGALLLFIPAVVITAVSHWTFQQSPVVRQALIYDASISLPHDEHKAVSNSLATLFNWLVFLVALPVVELLIFRRQHSLTAGLANMLHHGWSCLVVFLTVIAITEITKPFSGRLRPDFLARCRPEGQHDAAGTSAGGNPLGALHVGQVASCTQPNADVVHQGRLSFPSGHASNTMSVAWYTAMYLMWSLFLRADAPCPRRLYATRGLGARLAREAAYAFAYAWVLLALCLSWFIGITRFWDDVHDISDIVGGWLLAIIFATPWVVKAIGTSRALVLEIDADDDGAAGAAAAGSSGGGAVLPLTSSSGAAEAQCAPAGPSAPLQRGGGRGGGGEVAIDMPPAR